MENKKQVVIIITRGLDDERASVAWSIAKAGINSGINVTVFLASSGVDWARKKAADKVRLNPDDPTLGEMMQDFMAGGKKIYVCPPCASMRGYEQKDLIQGAEIVGPNAIYDPVLGGAATLTF